MKRCTLLMPLVIFMAIAMLLLWQLARNVEGDDPNSLESALIGKRYRFSVLRRWKIPGSIFSRMRWPRANRCCLTSGRPGARPVAQSISI